MRSCGRSFTHARVARLVILRKSKSQWFADGVERYRDWTGGNTYLLTHLFRTVLMVLSLTVIFIALLVGAILLRVPPVAILIGVAVLFGVFVIGSARWHAYWAPMAKTMACFKWQNSVHENMETVVENAIVQVGMSGQASTLRVSIYNRTTGKRLCRRLIGDDATYLGLHGCGLWFFIHDRFHARKDGLVCVDRATASWLYHRPQAELRYVSEARQHGTILVELVDGPEEGIVLASLQPNVGVWAARD